MQTNKTKCASLLRSALFLSLAVAGAAVPVLGASATLIKTDTTTGGSWKGVYGLDGARIANQTADPLNPSTVPAYAVVTPALAGQFNWQNPVTDPAKLAKALQKTGATDQRIGSAFYNDDPLPGGFFDIHVNLTDGQTHKVALYAVDWEPLGREQRIDVLEFGTNTLLSTTTHQNFGNGVYSVWDIQGYVVFRVTRVGPQGRSAAISGIFFGADTSPAISIVSPASGGTVSGLVSLSAAIVKPITVTSVQFKLDGANIGSPITTGSPNYAFNWNSNGASSGAHVLTAEATDNTGKKYVSDPVNITVSNVVLGNSATYIRTDTPSPAGNWRGVYGFDGHWIAKEPTNVIPSYMTISGTNATGGLPRVYSYTDTPTDADKPIALQWFGTPPASITEGSHTIVNPSRNPSVFYDTASLTYNLQFNDGLAHQVAIYVIDFDNQVPRRTQTITILNGDGSDAVLDTKAISDFGNGQYLIWNMSGKVKVRFDNTNLAKNLTFGGFFFGSGGTPPTITMTSPAAGPVSGSVTLSANASSSSGNPTVQFKVDGVNFGSPISAPPYTIQWPSNLATSGLHVLSAVATDAANLSATDAVNVTVNNDPPTITFTNPGPGAPVSGIITLSAAATAPGSSVASVQFFVDGTPFGPAIASPPFSIAWNTNDASVGSHTLSATVTATSGQTATTPAISVNVQRGGPTVTMTGPTGVVSGTFTLTAVATPEQAPVQSVQFTISRLYPLGPPVPGPGPNFSLPQVDAAILVNGQTYEIGATATDTLGQVAVSNYLTITGDNPPPSISVSVPSGDQGGTITLTANATSPKGKLSSVQFKVDGQNIGQPVAGAGPAFTLPWNTGSVANGSHVITAVVSDWAQQTAESAPVSVSVLNGPPTISMTAPANNANVSGSVPINVTTTASAGMASVQFKVDGNIVGTVSGPGPTFSFNWPSGSATLGSHSLTATAIDTAGQQATSNAITVNVIDVAEIQPSAFYLRRDTGANGTKGNWKGKYGKDGFVIAGSTAVLPVYATSSSQLPVTSGTLPNASRPGFWLYSATSDVTRDLQKPDPATDRVRATYHTNSVFTSFDYDVNIGDGQVHQLAIYAYDLECSPPTREQTISILRADNDTVLNTQTLSNFCGGEYVLWNIQGHVKVRTTWTTGLNAVVNGIFFDTELPPPPPPVISLLPLPGTVSGTVTVTANASALAGMKSVQFKVDGNNVGIPVTGTGPIYTYEWNTTMFANGPHTVAAVATDDIDQTTTSASLSVTTNNPVVPPTVTMTAPASGASIAGTAVTVSAAASSVAGMASVQFLLDGQPLGPLQSGPGPNYSIPWNSSTAAAGDHTLSATATDLLQQTKTSDPITVTIVNPIPGATFISEDTPTAPAGNWKGKYGTDGWIIPGDSTSLPPYATVSGPDANGKIWAYNGSASPIALLKGASATDRTSSMYYSSKNADPFTFDINIIDANKHELALYLWDFENFATNKRDETITFINAQTNAMILQRRVTDFGGGKYIVFHVSGHILLRIQHNAGPSAVLTGLFFKTPPPPPTVSITTPAPNAPVTGTVALTAIATAVAPATITSVQFQLDGNPIGSPISGSSPYTLQWNSAGTFNGPHTLTAVATDSNASSTTSTSVNITTSNVPGDPVISITSPAPGATVSNIVTLTANASSPIGISSVQFKVNGANLGGPQAGAGPSYSVPWDTRTLPNGSYTLSAVAIDTQGRPGSSNDVAVTVGNIATSATFVKYDTATKGNWKNVYGADGYVLAGDGNSSPPAYATVPSPSQAGIWNYTTLAGSASAPQKPGSTTARTSTVYYTTEPNNNPFTFDITFSDAAVHELALYAWDADHQAAQARAETITILDAVTNAPLVAKQVTVAEGFKDGVYVVFRVSGHILVRVTKSGPRNAMLSGLFFATPTQPPPPPTVSIVTPGAGATLSGESVQLTATAAATAPATLASVQFLLDGSPITTPVAGAGPTYSTTWNSRGVANGAHVLTARVTDSFDQTNTSAPLNVTTQNDGNGGPVISVTSPTPGQQVTSGFVTVTANAVAPSGIASVQFRVDGNNFGAPQTGPGPSYSITWDTSLLTGSHTLSAVATDKSTPAQSASSAVVTVTIAPNPTSATYLRTDINSKGDWKGKFGVDGYVLAGDANSPPSYVTVTPPPMPTVAKVYPYNTLANSPSALQKASASTGRIAAVYYTTANAVPFAFDLAFNDGKSHELALYTWDVDKNRIQTIKILNGDTNAELLTRQLTDFKDGIYTVFRVSGHVVVQISYNAGPSAILNALFFATPPPPPAPPSITIVTPVSGAELTGQRTLTANASAAAGIKSVQFYLDGDPITSPLTNAGPTYTAQWNSAGAVNGSHILTAVATDTLDQTTTSANVSITTNNEAGPPVITLTAPTPGAYSGLVKISATATSSTGIASVQFKINGANLGPPQPGSGTNYSFDWDTAGIIGTRTLTAVATDTLGRSTESNPPIQVTIVTSGPFGEFVRTDATATPRGDWKALYGSEGYFIPNDSSNLPASLTLTGPGVAPFSWPTGTNLQNSPSALVRGASSTQRIASAWPSAAPSHSFTFDFNFSDVNHHELALYVWDPDTADRRQKIEIINPANNNVLASWQATSSFSSGAYVVFKVGGRVLVRVTRTAGLNAVVNGIFLKTLPPPPPPPPPPSVQINSPAPGQTLTGPVTLSATATANAPATIASVQFRVDGNLIGQPIQTVPYTLQWDSAAVVNGQHTLTALATDSSGQSNISGSVTINTNNVVNPPQITITSPSAGSPVTGTVTITANATSAVGIASVQFQVKAPGQSQAQNLGAPVTSSNQTFSVQWPTASLPAGAYALTAVATDRLSTPQSTTSAEVSVTVTPPANSAVFVKSDSTTLGNWKNTTGRVYGEDGFLIPNDSPATMSPSYSPTGYATVSFADATTWSPTNPNTLDSRDLRKGSNPAGDAPYFRSTYLNANSFTVNVNMTDSQLHQMALYFFDYDGNRQQTVQILDGDSGDLLVTRSVSNFKTNGVYLVFNVRGKIRVKITKLAGTNAVLNGIFFRSFTGMTPPNIMLISPAGGPVQETVSLVANATSAQGIASVQFQLNGTTIPGTVTNEGPAYTQSWVSRTVFDGDYTLTAVAVDNLGLSSTSLGPTIRVQNGQGVQPTASFSRFDTATRGAWVGKYGSQGYIIAGVAGQAGGGAKSIPPYLVYDPAVDKNADAESDNYWLSEQTGPYGLLNGLQKSPTDLTRRGTYFTKTNSNLPIDQRPPLEFNLKFMDSQEHQVAIYFLDWHHWERQQRVQILELLPDGTTGNVLNSIDMVPVGLSYLTEDKGRGVYAIFNVRGNVKLRVKQFNAATENGPVLSGIFFDPKQ